MSELETIKERNRELARKINEEALANPNSPYAGKFVGIANGQVVCTGDNLTEVANCVRAAEANPEKTFFIEAGIDYDQVVEIWSLD